MYTKLDFKCENPEMGSLLIALLSERQEFAGFEELEDGQISSHIEANDFSLDLQNFINEQRETVVFDWQHENVAAQNWNTVWESNYEPVEVGNFCRIRANFHPIKSGFVHEILITPKMSFGTGHHATTFSVISLMQEVNFDKKSVLDYGSGTGVLAILAAKMGANLVEAVDIEQWAYHNSIENTFLNQCEHIFIQQGEIFSVKNKQFSVILANINRNVLMDTMQEIAKRLENAGTLILSGFYAEKDADMIAEKAAEFGLKLQKMVEKDSWAALLLTKQNSPKQIQGFIKK
jgi:ribosomal protein L11 methyltransferase